MIAELLLILLPLSIMWLVALTLLVGVIEADLWQIIAGLLAGVLLTAPLVALVRLALTFAERGSTALKAIQDYWWLVATLGGGMVLTGVAAQVVVLGTGDTIRANSALCIVCAPMLHDDFGLTRFAVTALDVASYVVWFAPLLLPLIHVWLERNRKHAL